MQEIALRVPRPVAKQRIDLLASKFQDVADEASNAGTSDLVATVRSKYEALLAQSNAVLLQCFQDDKHANSFLSETELKLCSEPSRSDERESVLAGARRGHEILTKWVTELDS
jgi:hypothetical protein